MSVNYPRSTTSRAETGANSASLVPFTTPAETLTYEPYFGLNEKPFSLNADERFVYNSPAHAAASQGLLAGIRRREGLLVLTGEIGTGKTTLCRAVLRELGRKTYSSLVPDPFASREDLLKMLLIDFGVMSIQDLTTGPLRHASRTDLGYLLSDFLESLTPESFVVVIIDEAQNLSLPLIEETRILSDTFGLEGRLQIVFVGQPELHAKLKLPEMRQVDQRVCGYHRLAPMSREAVAGYIQHRLQVAGNHRERVLFPAEIVDVLHQRSGGVPRLINRVCDRALQIAYDRKANGVDREVLDTALIEVGSVTLSPTWDSIVFAEPAPAAIAAAAPAAPAPTVAPAPAAVAPPAPAAAPAKRVLDPTPRVDDDAAFRKKIDEWVEQELAPPSRTLTPVSGGDAPPSQRRPTSRPARRESPVSTGVTDWPRDTRSETYLQKLLRTWMKRAAILLAVFAGANLALAGASFLAAALSSPALPAAPAAPVAASPATALPDATQPGPTPPGPATPDAPAADVPAATTAIVPDAKPVATSGATTEYLVGVGLFASSERADQLLDTLTQSGLPAMQRPFQLGAKQVHQVVLGPFFSRADAVAEMRRLQGLGGFDDATLISSTR